MVEINASASKLDGEGIKSGILVEKRPEFKKMMAAKVNSQSKQSCLTSIKIKCGRTSVNILLTTRAYGRYAFKHQA